MESEKLLGLVALGWLIFAFILMARSVQRGKKLADTLATRHPETYEALGRPRPGYFHSARRSRFAQFVARREYDDIGDPALSAEFEAHKKSETRLVLSLVASLVVLALFIFALRSTG
jgi:hypothetical protein